MTATASAVQPEQGRRLRTRHLWIVPGLAIAIFANTVAGQHVLGLVPLLLFGILPHLPAVLGFGQPTGRGQLTPRAVPLFNVMHHPAVPLALLALAATGVLPAFWLVGALAWLSHIVVDWGMGDGLRSTNGYRLHHVRRLIGVGGR